ncbi:MAG: hypothetical protein ACSW8A_00690 [Lachnospiraceae bacterium]
MDASCTPDGASRSMDTACTPDGTRHKAEPPDGLRHDGIVRPEERARLPGMASWLNMGNRLAFIWVYVYNIQIAS